MLQEMNLSPSLDEPGLDPRTTPMLDAIIQVRPHPACPRLFSAAVKPRGQVVFSVARELGKIRVEFEGSEDSKVPLDNVTSTFDIFPGIVTFRVKDGASSDHYKFTVQRFNSEMRPVKELETLILEVAVVAELDDPQPLDKVGFACSASEPITLQSFLAVRSAAVDFKLEAINHTGKQCTLALRNPNHGEWKLKVGDRPRRPIPITGLGRMIQVIFSQGEKLGCHTSPPSVDSKDLTQSGGTEQFEIIIEPD